MTLFLTILLKILPLYLTILLGFIAARVLKVSGHNIALLMFYIIVPVVVFSAVANVKVTASLLSFPLLVFGLCTVICFAFLWLGKRFWPDNRANVLALMACEGNAGYFGVPVAMIMFPEEAVNVYIVGIIGMILFENSIAFYVTAKGRHTVRDSVIKVLRLPSLYAFFFGVMFSLLGLEVPAIFDSFTTNIRGAYVTLGMMIIGFALSGMEECKMDWKLFSTALFAKFVVWPLAALGVIFWDRHWGGLYNEQVYSSLILLSIVPIAANTVVIATILEAHPAKVAKIVLASTLIALIFVPLMASVFLR